MNDLKQYTDLTIRFSRPSISWGDLPSQDLYWAEMFYNRPDDSGEQSPASGLVRLPLANLRAAGAQPAQFGSLLRQSVFDVPDLKSFFDKSTANAAGVDMRIRIQIDSSAIELHSLFWETLREPEDINPDPAQARYLAQHAGQPFSRFLSSPGWGKIDLRQQGSLKALVVIANPSTLETDFVRGQRLAKVDVEGESARAKSVLEDNGVTVDWLVTDSANQSFVTIDRIIAQLSKRFDILYLVCHGMLLQKDPQNPADPRIPWLVLENDQGRDSVVDANLLAGAIRKLHPDDVPRLVVLASCQSAGDAQVGAPQNPEASTDSGALSAAGPRLVDAGVPAVLAMQDNISMDTVKAYMPSFFEKLLTHGQVDRAAAEARAVVSTRPDWWVPVLYLRLRGGQLWYKPGFTRTDQSEYAWDGLLDGIEKGCSVPIIGPGLLESMIGAPDRIARELAEQSRYPFAVHTRQEMPQVAQFLTLRDGRKTPREKLAAYLVARLQDHCTRNQIVPASQTLSDLLTAVGERNCQNELDPFRLLAQLPFTMFINTNPDNFLEQALRKHRANCDPQVMYYRWNTKPTRPELIMRFNEIEANQYVPSYQKPLIFHMFGVPNEPDSWVLSEDDFFEYLMWVNRTDNYLPTILKNAFINNSLLFMGFRLSDWNFRVLYKSILHSERWKEITSTYGLTPDYHSVAVQIQPGDDNLIPEGVRSYLTKYFPSSFYDLFWGSPENFLSALWKAWVASGRKTP